MAAVFRIVRQSEKFHIYKRIFFIYYELGYVTDFKDCLGIVCNFCTFYRIKRVLIRDPTGPNKKMPIEYTYHKGYDHYFKDSIIASFVPARGNPFERFLQNLDIMRILIFHKHNES